MKIKFIGVGSAFTTQEYYQSNLLIYSETGKKMLVDCGSDARFALAESCNINNTNLGKEIDAVYISHLHADHIGSMEWLALVTYFTPDSNKPELFMEKNLIKETWNHSLKGGLSCVQGKVMHLTDYFLCHSISSQGSFTWEGIKFTLIKTPHIITGYKDHSSFGLFIEQPEIKGQNIFFTADTQFQPDLLTKLAEKADIIFHDCETSPFKTGVHSHYNDLCTMATEIKKKMWLYHYQPNPDQKPEKDGFKGFVKKGQEFDFKSHV